MDPKVPSSKPLPNIDTYEEEEKNEEIRNTTGIARAKSIILSLGIKNFPSPSLAISQKNSESVVPTDIKKPLFASRVTDTYGRKKNNDRNKVARSVKNDTVLKNSIFLDSIVYILKRIRINYT